MLSPKLLRWYSYLWIAIGLGYLALDIRLSMEPGLMNFSQTAIPIYLCTGGAMLTGLLFFLGMISESPFLRELRLVLTGFSLPIAPIALAILVLAAFCMPSRFPRSSGVSKGMTKEEVRKQLGEPWQKRRYSTGGEAWIYQNGFSQPIGLDFDANGKLLQ